MFKKLLVWFFLGSTTSSSTLHNEAEVGDDDVFTVSTCQPSSFSLCSGLHGQVRRGFSFYASGLAFSHHRVWTLDVFYLLEVYPLQNVRPLVGLLSPREKHVRAGDVSS